jgi:hypothetical protein
MAPGAHRDVTSAGRRLFRFHGAAELVCPPVRDAGQHASGFSGFQRRYGEQIFRACHYYSFTMRIEVTLVYVLPICVTREKSGTGVKQERQVMSVVFDVARHRAPAADQVSPEYLQALRLSKGHRLLLDVIMMSSTAWVVPTQQRAGLRL